MNKKNNQLNNIIYWHRYVDDILILFKGTQRQLQYLHNYINNIHTKIKFTLEIETNRSINFLDLTLHNLNGQHSFKIFRKPTQTDHTIHNSSHHPYQHKIAAYYHLLNRLNNIPMQKQDYDDELTTIKYIANSNGYTENIIQWINSKIKNKIHLQNLSTLYNYDYNNTNKKYISTTYNNITSNSMKKILKQFGYTIAYTTNHKLIRELRIQQKDDQESGIYRLSCNDCDKFYIGQTGRSFTVRFKEHTDELKKVRKNYKSKYAQHIAIDGHTYTNIDTNLSILHRLSKGNYMDRYEEFEIYKHRHNPFLLNDKSNFKTNVIYDMIMDA